VLAAVVVVFVVVMVVVFVRGGGVGVVVCWWVVAVHGGGWVAVGECVKKGARVGARLNVCALCVYGHRNSPEWDWGCCTSRFDVTTTMIERLTYA
jgi:hypothetical protein